MPESCSQPHSVEPVRIDLDAVLSRKLGSKARWVPRFLVDWLKRTVHQDELNEILSRYPGVKGAEFCRAMIKEFDLKLDVRFPFGMPDKSYTRPVIACNHPLGGLDGIALIAYFTDYYGIGPRFVVNDILMAVEPLRDVFIPVNKHGAQSRKNLALLDEVLDGERPVIVFPAGLVSRKNTSGQICDLDWNKMFVTKSLQFGRNILPVHFQGQNSPFFYNLALWRKRLFIPFNIEMLYLPEELIIARGKRFHITVGETIPCSALKGENPRCVAAKIKDLVYSLGNSL